MDLLRDACHGAPLCPERTHGIITTRYWTGAVGQQFTEDCEISLFLERKELLIACDHVQCSLWWNWCLGFNGCTPQRVIWPDCACDYFWRGFAYSQPRAGLGPELADVGLKFISHHGQGLAHDLYDSCSEDLSKFTRRYIRGVPVADIARRPLDWLPYLNLSRPMGLLNWGQGMARTLEDFHAKFANLTLKELCKYPLQTLEDAYSTERRPAWIEDKHFFANGSFCRRRPRRAI